MIDPGFHDLYEREFAAVFRAALLLCGDRAAAEDATQEAFARALVRWRRLDGQPWAAGWVMTTAMNLARRAMRRQPVGAGGPSPSAVDQDAQLDVRSALRKLPARQQEAVALHYLLDLSVEETAAAMNVTQGTVKAHLSRARQALGDALGVPEIAESAVDELKPGQSSERHSSTEFKRRANDG